MTHFNDGPAAGIELLLKRTPLFLRVTQTPLGQWDALDELDDEAKPDERLFAYVLVEKTAGPVHLRLGQGKSGYYPRAWYRFVEEQPPQDTMRRRARWRLWTEEEMFHRRTQ